MRAAAASSGDPDALVVAETGEPPAPRGYADVPPSGRPGRVTLDGQLQTYWEREAGRLETLAAAARAAWQRRRYLRKAEAARAKAEASRQREAARGTPTGDAGDLAAANRFSSPSNLCRGLGR